MPVTLLGALNGDLRETRLPLLVMRLRTITTPVEESIASLRASMALFSIRVPNYAETSFEPNPAIVTQKIPESFALPAPHR